MNAIPPEKSDSEKPSPEKPIQEKPRVSDQKKFLTWMTYIAGGFIALYLVMVWTFYAHQDDVLFVPGKDIFGPPPASLQKGGPPLKLVSVTTADNLTLLAWFAPPSRPDGKVVVLFPANADPLPPPKEKTAGEQESAPVSAAESKTPSLNGKALVRVTYVDPATARAVRIASFRKHGYGIFFCEYRGYGGNPGAPSEAGLYADARAGLAWLKAHGFGPAKLIFDGVSLGAGVAVQMAVDEPPSALILEAPFTSLSDQVKMRWSMLPVDQLLKSRFDNLQKISQLKAPLLIVHGDKDPVIPVHFAETLFEAAGEPKQLAVLEGAGHQDLYDFGAGGKILAWLDKLPKGSQKR